MKCICVNIFSCPDIHMKMWYSERKWRKSDKQLFRPSAEFPKTGWKDLLSKYRIYIYNLFAFIKMLLFGHFWAVFPFQIVWNCFIISESWAPELMTIIATWQFRVRLDSIRNSCDFIKKKLLVFLYKSFISFLCFSHKSFGNFFYVSSLILSHFDFVFVFKILQTSWLGLEIKPPSAWNRIMTLGRTNVAQAENDCTTEWIFESTDCSSRFSRVDRSNPTTLNTKLHVVNW